MRLIDIDAETRQELDTAAGGIFAELQVYCEVNRYEAHLTIQTHLDGLEKDEMKLYIQIVGGLETLDYAVARLGGKAKIIGWNIYLHDTLASAKTSITRATDRFAAEPSLVA